MKQVVILLLLVLNRCDGNKIIKRFITEQNNATDDSFQVNVSAGYGVHSENTTVSSPSPVYQFQERKVHQENETRDQISQPSQAIQEIIPIPSYQVHEKGPEVVVVKNHRHRSAEKRVRQRTKPVEVEYKQPSKLAAGTKIVEVLRVPAMYELHLQTDPQRLASLNTAWLNKLMNQNQIKRPTIPQFYNNGATRNLLPQASTPGLSFSPGPHQRFANIQNQKPKYITPKLITYQQQIKTQAKKAPQTQNVGGFKHNYVVPQSYQNYQQTSTESSKDNSAQSSSNYQLLSNEIPSNYYQKPQALHEVPAPVLNKQPHKNTLPKMKSTSIPNLVYGKPIDPPYQPSTQVPPSLPTPSTLWGSSIQEQNSQNGLLSLNYQLSAASNYQPQQQQPLQQQQQPLQLQHQQPLQLQQQQQPLQLQHQQPLQLQHQQPLQLQHQQPLQLQQQQQQPQQGAVGAYYAQTSSIQNAFDNNPNYPGHRNVQNYYNDAIGDYLDQTLVNTNGGVATFLNNDGTMTISNFHHNPKLYERPADDYAIPVTENTDEMPQDLGIIPYQNNDMTNFNNQLFPPYSPQIPISDNQIETMDTQQNLILANARSGNDVPTGRYGRGPIKRMYPRFFSSSSRRVEPMDYILYIKERTIE